MRQKNTKRRNALLAMLCGVAAVVCVAAAFSQYLKKVREERLYEQMRSVVPETVQTETTEETVAAEVPETEALTCEPIYDFEELRAQNEDIYAWITVPGTQTDYPVLQSETDNYYLEHNLDGSSGYPGTIYTNKCNAKDFSDYNTVLYGHNMGNGTMFGDLHLFEEETFFEEHDRIIVYTQEKRLTYQIYAAVKFSDVYIPAYYDVHTAEGMLSFAEALENYMDEPESHLRADMSLTGEDRLITLSTCVKNERPRRYLVIGKLTEEASYADK